MTKSFNRRIQQKIDAKNLVRGLGQSAHVEEKKVQSASRNYSGKQMQGEKCN